MTSGPGPHSTMAEVCRAFPGAPLALFARYGIGSREKSGFRPEQVLRDVLARHLVFAPEEVLTYLEAQDRDQRRLAWTANPDLSGFAHLVDVRSPEEFALASLPGARLLDAEVAGGLLSGSGPVLFFDRAGPMAATAALHFAGKGVQARWLEGGLEEWALLVDPRFPRYGAGPDMVGGVRVLPDRHQARFTFDHRLVEPGRLARLEVAGLPALAYEQYLTVRAPEPRGWDRLSQQIWCDPVVCSWREPRPGDPVPDDLHRRVSRVLESVVGPTLRGHEGTVSLDRVEGLIAYVRLGGGCQGCSSAALTVNEEIAANILRAVPEIFEVRDATDHEAGLRPHH